MKVKEVLTALDDLNLFERLRERYYVDWREAGDDRDAWETIRIKLSLIDDLREELRKIANTEGMDNASKRT